MRIQTVLIALGVQAKIFKKHGVRRQEIENGLLSGNILFLKTRQERYLAITHEDRYLTVVFEYQNQCAFVVTAYPSSDWQIKRFINK
ncbi:MAG: DUF4258 domain-containing protein [Candidatus Diapherotrites archaeon]|uniref:DUF4258 domain-containing protein n=1 Tax=Candidatus Iainarchaeum sp. TaxID=3101447 RepID=A0A8T3YK35_9ARCH|nr:DUF4258 domain-containing protein [Candidatus Diapherotrites archaeon]